MERVVTVSSGKPAVTLGLFLVVDDDDDDDDKLASCVGGLIACFLRPCPRPCFQVPREDRPPLKL